MSSPKWLDDALFYEIYPQSFKDTNDDGIGDFNGIIEKLDYIKDLGFNAIWINPCFESPFLDAGYDVSDYKKIAPRYGTNEDAARLFAEAHKRQMHILFDLVPGHTSIKHRWFEESCKGEVNEYSDRYVWTDNVWESPKGLDAIRGFSERDGSCVVNFFSHQPALNYGFFMPDSNEEWQQSVDDPGPQATLEEMISVMRFWLDMGCDGFRVDMAGSLVKNDPESKGTIRLWQYVMSFLDKEYPEAAMVSEWGEPDKSLLGGFHMDFLLHFGPSHYNDLFRCEHPYFIEDESGNIKDFIEKYKDTAQKAGDAGLICIPSGNHDMDRLSRRLSEAEVKLAFGFLLSMPGVPFVYYGDEIGMRYVEGLKSVEGGYSRTGSRTPMQWNDDINSGFSNADKDKLYICQDPEADRPTVEKAYDDDSSILNELKRMVVIRKENEALHNRSKIEFVNAGYPLVYKRIGNRQQMLVIINPSDKSKEVEAPEGKIIYSIGKTADYSQGSYKINPVSAIFVDITGK